MKNGRHSAEAQGDEELLRRRRVPALYVLDESLHVVLSWRMPHDPDLGSRGQRLPRSIERAVSELLDDDDGANVQMRLLDEGHVVRLARLQGSLGAFTGVFIEPFKARDHLGSGIVRFALTRREREVIQLLIDGARTSDIAQRLGIAGSTVVLHIKSAMAKTHSRSRTEMLGKILSHQSDGKSAAATV